MDLEYTPAFILHTRPYKENQLLIEFLVAGKGRVSIVGYKGSKKNSAKTALFRPFRPLLISYNKTSGLRTLKQVEANPAFSKKLPELAGKCLFSGFYLNEITCRLCRADAEFEQLYPLYVYTMQVLAELSQMSEEMAEEQSQKSMMLEWVLRQFEYRLLQMLGYGISFDSDVDSAMPIQATATYELIADRGFSSLASTSQFSNTLNEPRENAYLGSGLLGVAQRLDNNLLETLNSPWDPELAAQTKHELSIAKQVLRQCLHLHLGDKPIKSRELFRK